MNIYNMIQEWKKGCSDSRPGHPEDCKECTLGLVNAIEKKTKPQVHYLKGAAKSPDNVLDQARGVYDKVLLLGLDEENCVDVRVSTNMRNEDILWCIEKFKRNLLLDLEHGH